MQKRIFAVPNNITVRIIPHLPPSVKWGGAIRERARLRAETAGKIRKPFCEKRILADGTYEALPVRESAQNYVHTEPYKQNVEKSKVLVGHRLSEVVFGTLTMDEYLSQWSDKELATFFVSYDQNQVGCSDALCVKYGLNRFSQGDGGMGLCFMGTAYPCSAILASTWNDALIEAFGLLLGAELYKNNVGMWLGPPVNMRRNPLAGRNLEYAVWPPSSSRACSATAWRCASST